MKSDAERERVIQCLKAAIERRVSEVSTKSHFEFGSYSFKFYAEKFH